MLNSFSSILVKNDGEIILLQPDLTLKGKLLSSFQSALEYLQYFWKVNIQCNSKFILMQISSFFFFPPFLISGRSSIFKKSKIMAVYILKIKTLYIEGNYN